MRRRGKRKKFRLKNIRRFLCFCFPFGKKKADAYQIESDSEALEAQFCSSQTRAGNLEICADVTVCALSQNELSSENEMCIQAGDEDCLPRQWLPKQKVLSTADISPEALLALIIPGICDSLPSWDQYMYQQEDVPGFIFMYPSNNSGTVSCMHYYPTSLVYYAICLWRLYLQWQAYIQIGTSAGRGAYRIVALSGRAVLQNFLMVASKLTHIKEVSKMFLNNQYTIETFVTSVPAHPALFKAIFGHLYYRKVGYSYGVPVVVVQNIALGMKRFGDMKPEYPGQRPLGGQLVLYSRLTNASIGLSPSLQAMSYIGTVQNTTRPVPLPRWKVVMYSDLHSPTVNVAHLQNKEICKVVNRYVDMKPEYPGQRQFGKKLVQYLRPTNVSIGPSPSLQVMPYKGAVQNTTRPVPLLRWKVVMYSDLHLSTVKVVRLQNKEICKVLNRYGDMKHEYPGQRPFGGQLVQYSRPTNVSIGPSPSLQVMPCRGTVEYPGQGPFGRQLVQYSRPNNASIGPSPNLHVMPCRGTVEYPGQEPIGGQLVQYSRPTNVSIGPSPSLQVTPCRGTVEYPGQGPFGRQLVKYSRSTNAYIGPSPKIQVTTCKGTVENKTMSLPLLKRKLVLYSGIQPVRIVHLQNTVTRPSIGTSHPQVLGHFMLFKNHVRTSTARSIALPEHQHVNAFTNILSSREYLPKGIWTIPTLAVLSVSNRILAFSVTSRALMDSINNVNQNIMENDDDGNDDEDEDDDADDNDDEDDDDDDDDVQEDVNRDSNVDNIKSQTSSANVNVTVIGDNEVMVKIDARTKVNDVGYNPGASDHVISYVESLDNMSPDDTAPLVKTHPKAILHASSDPPPQQDQHKRTDLLTVAGNSSQFELRTDDIGLTVSNPSMFALFEQPGYSLDAAPLFILHTEMSNHNARKRTKLRDTAICICALAFSTTISPRRWDRELLNLIVEDAAGVEATILQHTKKEDCSMDQLPQNVNITFESLHSGPQSLRLGIKQIISGSLTSLGSAPSKDCLRTTHSDLNELLTALKLTLKLHSSIGAVMWCTDTVYAVMRVRYNKIAQYKEDRVVLLTITQTDLIMEIFESLCGCVTFITSLFDTPESFRLLPIYKYTSSLHHVMRYFKMSK